MAKYTFTVGEKLTAARTNNFCQEGEVTNSSLSTTAGEPGGAWEAYTPTLTNITNATATGRYLQIGKTVWFWAKATMTGTPTISATPTISLPVTAQTDALSSQFQCHLVDSGTLTWHLGVAIASSTTAISCFAAQVSSPDVRSATTTGSVPFSWATGDVIELAGTYEAA